MSELAIYKQRLCGFCMICGRWSENRTLVGKPPTYIAICPLCYNKDKGDRHDNLSKSDDSNPDRVALNAAETRERSPESYLVR